MNTHHGDDGGSGSGTSDYIQVIGQVELNERENTTKSGSQIMWQRKSRKMDPAVVSLHVMLLNVCKSLM